MAYRGSAVVTPYTGKTASGSVGALPCESILGQFYKYETAN